MKSTSHEFYKSHEKRYSQTKPSKDKGYLWKETFTTISLILSSLKPYSSA